MRLIIQIFRIFRIPSSLLASKWLENFAKLNIIGSNLGHRLPNFGLLFVSSCIICDMVWLFLGPLIDTNDNTIKSNGINFYEVPKLI